MTFPTKIITLGLVAVVSVGLSGCVLNNPTTGKAITVTSSNTECTLSANEAAGGTIEFTIKNTGDKITEFYVLTEDGTTVAGEAENIGPGLTRTLLMQAEPGTYYTVCKPGQTDPGIGNSVFTVTDAGASSALSATDQAQVDMATTAYAGYVREQIGTLTTQTEAFAAAYAVGDFDTARALYAPTRMYWERVETVAESFGDLDPKLDLREADLEEGQNWTGWHAIEKDLWPAEAGSDYIAYDQAQRDSLAGQLVADTHTLNDNVQTLSFNLGQLTNGAIGLLDEVATGKVTGEEEAWSHTDLYDFQANVEGAAVLYSFVREMLVTKNPGLAAELDQQFTTLQNLLDAQRSGDGFRSYTQLSKKEIKALADQVNALGEPLNKLTAALITPSKG